jgi:hypothetical protein
MRAWIGSGSTTWISTSFILRFGFQLGDEQDPRDRDGNLLYARRDLAQYMEGAAGVPSDEGIDRYLRPIVAILFLWLNQHISFATKVA